jgi:hypothetical protein
VALPLSTIGIAMMMPISASPVIRPAENSVPGDARGRARPRRAGSTPSFFSTR